MQWLMFIQQALYQGEPSLQPQERAFSEYEIITVGWEVAHSVKHLPCEHETPS